MLFWFIKHLSHILNLPYMSSVPPPGPCGIPGIPGSRDWTQIPIPGFLKIKSRDFSGYGMAHKTMFSNTFSLIFRQSLSLFETPRTFQGASNVYSTDPGRFYGACRAQDCPTVGKYTRIMFPLDMYLSTELPKGQCPKSSIK